VKRDIRRFDIRHFEMRLHVTYGSSFSVGSWGYHAGGLDRYARRFYPAHATSSREWSARHRT